MEESKPNMKHRRSSLFSLNQNEVSCTAATSCHHIFPPDYVNKLKSELELWDKEQADYCSSIHEKKTEVASQKYDNDVLSEGQLDFLSSLVDYNRFLKCVTDFNNRFEIASEKFSTVSEDDLENQRCLMEGKKRKMELAKKYF